MLWRRKERVPSALSQQVFIYFFFFFPPSLNPTNLSYSRYWNIYSKRIPRSFNFSCQALGGGKGGTGGPAPAKRRVFFNQFSS